MSPPALILASGSPRRRQLLGDMGLPFEVMTANTPELDAVSAPHLAPVELALENAKRKAAAVAKLRPGRWILGADTVVALGDRTFGKPKDLGQAHEFLRVLSGRTHSVITAVVLLGPAGEEDGFHEISEVTFLVLEEKEIERYVSEVNVLDKAGGYALQERGEWIIAKVQGSRANVIGLPTEKLGEVLRQRGLA